MRRLLIPAVVALALAACGPQLESGRIVERRWSEGYVSTVLMPTGSNGGYMPITTWTPPSYWFVLENCDTPEPGCVRGRRYVTEASWHDFEVGDWVTFE